MVTSTVDALRRRLQNIRNVSMSLRDDAFTETCLCLDLDLGIRAIEKDEVHDFSPKAVGRGFPTATKDELQARLIVSVRGSQGYAEALHALKGTAKSIVNELGKAATKDDKREADVIAEYWSRAEEWAAGNELYVRREV